MNTDEAAIKMIEGAWCLRAALPGPRRWNKSCGRFEALRYDGRWVPIDLGNYTDWRIVQKCGVCEGEGKVNGLTAQMGDGNQYCRTYKCEHCNGKGIQPEEAKCSRCAADGEFCAWPTPGEPCPTCGTTAPEPEALETAGEFEEWEAGTGEEVCFRDPDWHWHSLAEVKAMRQRLRGFKFERDGQVFHHTEPTALWNWKRHFWASFGPIPTGETDDYETVSCDAAIMRKEPKGA